MFPSFFHNDLFITHAIKLYFMKKTEQEELEELQIQVQRLSVFTQQELEAQSRQIHETSSFIYGLIDYFHAKGLLVPDELKAVIQKIQEELEEQNLHQLPFVKIRDDSKTGSTFQPVDCEARRPVCKSICCKLNFHLTENEIEAGFVKWDLGHPYHIRKQKNGFCTHFDNNRKCCGVYENRPGICRRYTCANDKRIWKDFDNMVLNHEWIQENLYRPPKLDESAPAMAIEDDKS